MYNPNVLNVRCNESQLRSIAQEIWNQKTIAATKQIQTLTGFTLKESLMIINEFTLVGDNKSMCEKAAVKFMRTHGYEFEVL